LSTVLLAPHADDETLFAFYSLLRNAASVVVVLSPDQQRQAELQSAMALIGTEWACLQHDPTKPNWQAIRKDVADSCGHFDNVIAPAYEEGGHEHHNEVAVIAASLGKPTLSYYTYVRGQGRTIRGYEVMPSIAARVLKRRAMDCYQSQINDPETAVWFTAPGWQVEYVEHEPS
jgi:LmbE family N-acetylglucosaminyl deacetylase